MFTSSIRAWVVIGGLAGCMMIALVVAPAQAAFREPVPDAAAQREAQRQVDSLFAQQIAGARSPEQRLSLAQNMVRIADESHGDPATRFVLLRLSATLAAQAGDVEMAFASLDTLAAGFEIEIHPLKREALVRASEGARSTVAQAQVWTMADRLAEEGVESGALDVARQANGIATTMARRINDAELMRLSTARQQELTQYEHTQRLAATAEAALARNPEDATANLNAGRFHAFFKRDWEAGLPLLARSSNAPLRAAAEADLARPATSEGRLQVADAWWELSEREQTAARRQMQVRAAHWYEQALPDSAGIGRARAEQRLVQAYPFGRTARTAREMLLETAWVCEFRSGPRRPVVFAADGSFSPAVETVRHYRVEGNRLHLVRPAGHVHSALQWDAAARQWVAVQISPAPARVVSLRPLPTADLTSYRPAGDDVALTESLRQRRWIGGGGTTGVFQFGDRLINNGESTSLHQYRVLHGVLEIYNNHGQLHDRFSRDGSGGWASPGDWPDTLRRGAAGTLHPF